MMQLLVGRDDHIPEQFIQRLCRGNPGTSFYLGLLFPRGKHTAANFNRVMYPCALLWMAKDHWGLHYTDFLLMEISNYPKWIWVELNMYAHHPHFRLKIAFFITNAYFEQSVWKRKALPSQGVLWSKWEKKQVLNPLLLFQNVEFVLLLL